MCRAACCCKSCRKKAARRTAGGRCGKLESHGDAGVHVANEELLTTDINTLMRRLFWEETIRVFEPQHPRFHCSCTREKVGNMLMMLGRQEVESALADLGNTGDRLRFLRPALRVRQSRLCAVVCYRDDCRCTAGAESNQALTQERIQSGIRQSACDLLQKRRSFYGLIERSLPYIFR